MLRYRDIKFKFENIGSVLGTAVDILGGLLIEQERAGLAARLLAALESEVPSLVCSQQPVSAHSNKSQ